jgi:hypothetical protein
MDLRDNWDDVVARLRRKDSLKIVQFVTGHALTADDHAVLKFMETISPPPAIMRFYESCNGIKLLWSGTLDGKRVQGSVNIVTLVKSALRAPAQESGAPLEGVLWNDELAPKVLKNLKRMAIFEEVAGRSAYITYRVDEVDGRLFYVEDDQIMPIVPDFDTTIALLKRYAGGEPLREYLTQDNWQERIAKDHVLQQIALL